MTARPTDAAVDAAGGRARPTGATSGRPRDMDADPARGPLTAAVATARPLPIAATHLADATPEMPARLEGNIPAPLPFPAGATVEIEGIEVTLDLPTAERALVPRRRSDGLPLDHPDDAQTAPVVGARPTPKSLPLEIPRMESWKMALAMEITTTARISMGAMETRDRMAARKWTRERRRK